MSTSIALKQAELLITPHQILLVDDEPHILRSLERLLWRKEFQIFTANNAIQALDILSKHNVQVMLTDHKMPNMTGVELIDIVCQRYPQILSIMLSAQADFEEVIRLLNNQSAIRFIKKPWSNEEVVNTIDKAFEQYEKNNQKTWLNRVNSLTPHVDSQGNENAVYRNKSRSEAHYVAAIQYLNITELARVVGQQRCEIIQAELVNDIALLLPERTEFSYYEPGLLVITLTNLHSEYEIKVMLTEVMTSIIKKVNCLVKPVHLDLKATFQHLQRLNISLELLIEKLKVSLQSASVLNPLVQLDAGLQNKLNREQQIKTSIASELDAGNFKLVIQPKVTLSNKLIESGEILLRWEHSTLGWISPLEFIDIAERDGQINLIGDWVLDQGILLISKLKNISPDIQTISINVSARQLYKVGFVEYVEALLTKYGVDALSLELEITESCIADDPNYIQCVLCKLKLLGIVISVDDFGTGGTAYSFLTTLPVRVLKLDKCMIDDIAFSSRQSKLVKSLIDICHSLGIDVVAEGVEDHCSREILESMNCNKIQGFIYSKALTPVDFEKLILKQPFFKK